MKAKTASEKAHLGRITRMGCLVCGSPAEAHHVVGYADRIGRAPKRHNRVAPLCPNHHRHGCESVHGCGSHRKFFELHGIDLMAEAARLWDESNDR